MTDNHQKLHPNIQMLKLAAYRLGPLLDEVVFLGGCTTALLVTDPAAPSARYTLDVDCIVDVLSKSDYYRLAERLHQQGFKPSPADDVICRWHFDELILDVMPVDEKVLGFGNRWNRAAMGHAQRYPLTDDVTINIVTVPYFLATKLEAFRTRGQMDFLASHDFEDIIGVLDACVTWPQEVLQADAALIDYLVDHFGTMLKMRAFHDALPGHFSPYGALAEERIRLTVEKITMMVTQNA